MPYGSQTLSEANTVIDQAVVIGHIVKDLTALRGTDEKHVVAKTKVSAERDTMAATTEEVIETKVATGTMTTTNLQSADEARP